MNKTNRANKRTNKYVKRFFITFFDNLLIFVGIVSKLFTIQHFLRLNTFKLIFHEKKYLPSYDFRTIQTNFLGTRLYVDKCKLDGFCFKFLIINEMKNL